MSDLSMRHIAMSLAEQLQHKSNCKKRSVVCVIFNDSGILSVGVNSHAAEKPCECRAGVHDPDVDHAEAIATRGRYFAPALNAQAAVTYAPCVNCAKELVRSGIRAVHVKQVRHTDGINQLEKSGIFVKTNHWLTEQRRIQAAWQIKWSMTGMDGYL